MTSSLLVPKSLAPYRSPEELGLVVRELTSKAGGTIHEIGESVEGRSIVAVELPSTTPTSKKVLWCANIHGIEFISAETVLGALSDAQSSTGMMAELRRHCSVWLIPSLNPDGYARTWNQMGEGTLSELRKNARGVDLNRNFARPENKRQVWLTLGGWRTGSDDPKNAFYRGRHPFSEPETRAVQTLSQSLDFHAGLNSHSTMGTVILPCVPDRKQTRIYHRLTRSFQGGQTRWTYKRLSSRWLDTFTGEQEDWQHHDQNTWAICVEHFALWAPWTRFMSQRHLFWRFNPPHPQPWIQNDLPGALGYFLDALSLPRPSELG